MKKIELHLVPYQDHHREALCRLWEQSVLATHDFLSTSDFEHIKTLVWEMDFNAFTVICAFQENQFVGFLGMHNQKIEMLFLHPSAFGKGIGKQLIHHAIEVYHCTLVDVNEQNHQAVGFYHHAGFHVLNRKPKDDLGFDYPILEMGLG
jgi:putative acetyltransferase